jgi:hypothetical protein
MFNSALAGARGRGRQLTLSSFVNEQAQSNRACNIFNFVVLGFLEGFCFLYFMYMQVCKEVKASYGPRVFMLFSLQVILVHRQ